MSSRFAEAIRQRRLVEFTYQGRSRTVEPHALGYDGSGALVLHGWELGGRSHGFRGFDTRAMRMLTVSLRQFDGARPEYEVGRLPLHTIVCAL
jgi:hypothetical protein